MNRQINNKNRNVHIGLVLAVLGISMLILAGTASAKIYDTNFWGKGFTPDTLLINTGDEVSWRCSNSNRCTIESIDGLFEPKSINYSQSISYIFDVSGRYQIKGIGYWKNDQGSSIQTISVNDVPTMKIVSYSSTLDGYAHSRELNIEVPIGSNIGFNITTNYDIDSVLEFNIPYSMVTKTNPKNVFMDVQFPSAGTFYIRMGIVSNTINSQTSMTWTVNVINPVTPIPTAVVTPIPTVTVTATPTATVTNTGDMNGSPGHPDEYWQDMSTQYPPNKRAILEVTNKIDRSDNGAIITVSVKNIGDDIARFVNFNSSIPSELGAELVSGANWDGNELIWRGDIGIGDKHDIIYKVKPAKIDINIPVKVTYVKDSSTAGKIMTKAAASGLNSNEASVTVDPQDLQVIYYVILITKAVLPGFEIVLGILGIGTIYILRRKNRMR